MPRHSFFFFVTFFVHFFFLIGLPVSFFMLVFTYHFSVCIFRSSCFSYGFSFFIIFFGFPCFPLWTCVMCFLFPLRSVGTRADGKTARIIEPDQIGWNTQPTQRKKNSIADTHPSAASSSKRNPNKRPGPATTAENKRARTTTEAETGRERGKNNDPRGAGEEEEEGLTVFVVNLAFTTKDSGLKSIFKGCGGRRWVGVSVGYLVSFFTGVGVEIMYFAVCFVSVDLACFYERWLFRDA